MISKRLATLWHLWQGPGIIFHAPHLLGNPEFLAAVPQRHTSASGRSSDEMFHIPEGLQS